RRSVLEQGPIMRPRGKHRGRNVGGLPAPFLPARRPAPPPQQQSPAPGGALLLWVPAPDEDGTGGIRDSSSGADIEAAPGLRRIWTHLVNSLPVQRHLGGYKA